MYKKIFYLFIVILFIFITSCTQHKKIIYFHNLPEENDTTQHYSNNQPSYTLKSGDIIFIKVISINEEISNMFNINTGAINYTFYSDAGMYINGFSINDTGYVNAPVLGHIKVAGFTVDEAQLVVQEKLDKYLKGATAVVKLLTYKITILGEVNRPGVYTNYNDNITILEALGMAGDITVYGNKKNILLLRPAKNGIETIRVNLNDAKLLETSNFYMLPNDILYVEPVKTKAFRMNAPNISIILSTITTFILVLNFIK